jgi:hypothetical protein
VILEPEDAALFYRAWGALLTWVNDLRGIVPRFPRPTPGRPINMQLALEIRKVVWAEDALRAQFLAEGAAELAQAERDLIASWDHRVSGKFTIFRHLQKHSIFLSDRVHAVLGIYSPFMELFPELPKFVEAVLLPFRDVIITDGLLQSPGMQISFGGGIRRTLNAQYSEARTAAQVRTTLPWRVDAEPLAAVVGPKPPRKPGRRRAH